MRSSRFQQRVHVLERALAGADHVLNIGMIAGGERVSIHRLRALGKGAADIDVVSPNTPAVASEVTESLRRLKAYLVLTFIVTSTGAPGWPGTNRIVFTLPIPHLPDAPARQCADLRNCRSRM